MGPQQSISDELYILLGQFSDAQNRPFLHSTSKSQSPSSASQGSSIVQNKSSPIFAILQQSVLRSNPSESGQLFDTHLRPSLHWLLESQSPSFSEHDRISTLHAQNPTSPTFTFAQSTEKWHKCRLMKTLLR